MTLLQRLVNAGKIIPLTYANEHRYLVSELNRFLGQELDEERRRRGA